MLTEAYLKGILINNPSEEVQVELDDLNANQINYSEVAQNALRKYRIIRTIKNNPDGDMAFYARWVVFYPRKESS